MKAAALALLLALSVLAASAEAQPARKVARVGFLSPVGKPGPAITALLQGLRELGYVEGQNIAIEVRFAEERLERLPALAEELIRLNVDVLVPLGPPASRAAKQATRTIPIVLVGNVDPVGTGLVASLARPGGNITGMSTLAAELSSKRLEILKAILPRLSRVGVFWDPGEPEEAAEWKELELAARSFGIHVQSLAVPAFGDVENAFPVSARAGVEALVNVGNLGPSRYRGAPILELAAKRRLPAVYGWPGLVQAGGLVSYSPDYQEIFRRAASHVDKILRGAKPADLPVEQPTKFELVVNLRTAKALGVTVPASVLLLADKVIE